jgi:hypothetical protein
VPTDDAGAGLDALGEEAKDTGGEVAVADAAADEATEGFETTRCNLQPSDIPLEDRDSESLRIDPLKTTLSRDASAGILAESCSLRSKTVAEVKADVSNSQVYVWPDTVMHETLTFAAVA